MIERTTGEKASVLRWDSESLLWTVWGWVGDELLAPTCGTKLARVTVSLPKCISPHILSVALRIYSCIQDLSAGLEMRSFGKIFLILNENCCLLLSPKSGQYSLRSAVPGPHIRAKGGANVA